MTDQDPLKNIEAFVRTLIQPDKEEWAAFEKALQKRTLKKKEIFLGDGQVCTSIGFVNSGLVREYTYDNGKDTTVDFVAENHFVVDFQSFLTGQPSRQYLEALTETELLILTKDAINKLYDQYKIWERFGRLIIERVFCGVEEKRKKIIATTHEEQYRHFASTYPELVQRVPQYYIASYLGLTPEHLSRIRKRS